MRPYVLQKYNFFALLQRVWGVLSILHLYLRAVEDHFVGLAAPGGEGEGVRSVAQGTRFAAAAFNDGLAKVAVFPNDAYFEITPCTQATDATRWPCRRQGGQEVQHASVALQQHFRNACRAAEVAVDLERRVHVP